MPDPSVPNSTIEGLFKEQGFCAISWGHTTLYTEIKMKRLQQTEQEGVERILAWNEVGLDLRSLAKYSVLLCRCRNLDVPCIVQVPGRCHNAVTWVNTSTAMGEEHSSVNPARPNSGTDKSITQPSLIKATWATLVLSHCTGAREGSCPIFVLN